MEEFKVTEKIQVFKEFDLIKENFTYNIVDKNENQWTVFEQSDIIGWKKDVELITMELLNALKTALPYLDHYCMDMTPEIAKNAINKALGK